MNKSYILSLRISWACMQRDWYVQTRRLHTWLINYAILKPVLYAFYVAYVQTRVFFGANGDPLRGTSLFAGEMLFVIFPLTYQLIVPLLYDLEGDRYIDYQLTFLNAKCILTQRIFFSSFFTFLMLIPFYPLAKLLLGSNIATDNTQWLILFPFLYICSLTISAYHMAAICILNNSAQTRTLWARINLPIIFLGGLSTPLFIIKRYSSALGTISYLNPAIYISEGLRAILLGNKDYLPINICFLMLTLFFFIFTLTSLCFFKKRIDSI